jgi:sialate O-acetylesterase
MRCLIRLILPLFPALWVPGVRAEVSLAPLFSDGAVLQRDKSIAVWGQADANEKVFVSFAGQRCGATAGSDGRWIVYLEPLTMTTQGSELVVAGKNTITVRDVLVGEVWLCSGQSNMEWPVTRAANPEAEIKTANYPLIRHVHVEHTVADTPNEAVKTRGWQAAVPANVGTFTAVGYFFAREIHQKLGVPIGIVHSSWGGTPIEAWMSPTALRSNPAFGLVEQRWQQGLNEFPIRKKAYDEQFATWSAAEAAAKAKSPTAFTDFARQNPRPRAPRGPGDPWTPTGLFNGMINPLLPYGLRGILWYQGENNAERAPEYHALFTAMITAWRQHFGQGEIPFYWVNLANFGVPTDSGERGRTWALLREAQTKTLALPQTGQAVTIDIGDPKNIHPANKQEVGRRLALLAKNRVYGVVCDDTGPTFAGASRELTASRVVALRVRFTHADGLIAHDKPVQSLELAGADRVFYPAEAQIERDTLLVFSPKVREPVAVRYAFSNAPDANLYNGAGLPTVPFRSDEW